MPPVSFNHRFGWKAPPKGPCSPPSHGQGCLSEDLVAETPIQPAPEHLQRATISLGSLFHCLAILNIKKIPFYTQSKSTLLQFKTATNPPKLTPGLCSISLSTLHAQNREEPAQLLLLKLRKMRTGGCNGTRAALAS